MKIEIDLSDALESFEKEIKRSFYLSYTDECEKMVDTIVNIFPSYYGACDLIIKKIIERIDLETIKSCLIENKIIEGKEE